MTYRVVNRFRDTEDNNRRYKVGDPYPKSSFKPTQERIDQLSEIHPKYKRVFIEKVEEDSDVGESSTKFTKTQLKKMNKSEQEELINQLNGDPNVAKNEEERISLIVQLQEKNDLTPDE